MNTYNAVWMFRGVGKPWIAPLVLLALTIGVHWKTLLTNQYNDFDKPDLTYQVAPWLQVQAAHWRHGGPLFWAQYSYLGLDPHGLKDRYADYWRENCTQSMINYEWCVRPQLSGP